MSASINTTSPEATLALEDMRIRSKDVIKTGKNKINGMSNKNRFSDKGAGYYEELQKMLMDLALL